MDAARLKEESLVLVSLVADAFLVRLVALRKQLESGASVDIEALRRADSAVKHVENTPAPPTLPVEE